MAYKTIVVHLDSGNRCAERLDVASRLALDFGAHLVGLYVTESPFPPGPLITRPGAEFIECLQARQRRQAQQVSDLFSERTMRAGLHGTEIRRADGDVVAALALHARYADLLVIGQTDPDAAGEAPFTPPDLPDETVLATPRPVLVVPYAGTFPRLGEHVLVAWDASRQAARSLSAALPLLEKARRVTVLVVNPDQSGNHGAAPGADVSVYLARHGVRVTARADEIVGIDVGNWLLSRSFDLQADLIVMGAYGHSLARERLFGGVTRSLLGQMTVPVLMEH